MMRFAVVKDEFTIAEFSGFRDALEYKERQTSYNRECIKIVPINDAEMPDNIPAIYEDLRTTHLKSARIASLEAWVQEKHDS